MEEIIIPLRLALCGSADQLMQLKEIFEPQANIHVVASAANTAGMIDQLDRLPAYPHVLLIGSAIAIKDDCKLLKRLFQEYPGLKLVALFAEDDNLLVVKKLIRYRCFSFFPEDLVEDLPEILEEEVNWSKMTDIRDYRKIFDRMKDYVSVLTQTDVILLESFTAGKNNRAIMLENGYDSEDFDKDVHYLIKYLSGLGLTTELLSLGLMEEDNDEPVTHHWFGSATMKLLYELKKIMLIEVDNEYVKVLTTSGVWSSPYLSTLTELETAFRNTPLIRVNPSMIINMEYVEKVNKDTVWVNNIDITVSEKYKDNFRTRMKLK
jgi:DNA-binding LytR/AlgR family response regulator